MADIHPRRNKKGELISFGIRVYHGYDRFGNRIKPSFTTFKANPEWSEKKIEPNAKNSLTSLKDNAKWASISLMELLFQSMRTMLSD